VSELEAALHDDLRTAEGRVIQLFAFVAEDVAVATEALLSSDADALTIVSERESIIDSLYREIEDLVNGRWPGEVRWPATFGCCSRCCE
jgi:phosphate uptake regulator